MNSRTRIRSCSGGVTTTRSPRMMKKKNKTNGDAQIDISIKKPEHQWRQIELPFESNITSLQHWRRSTSDLSLARSLNFRFNRSNIQSYAFKYPVVVLSCWWQSIHSQQSRFADQMAHVGLLQIDVEQLAHDVNNNGSLSVLLLPFDSPATRFFWQIAHDAELLPAIESFDFAPDIFLEEWNGKIKVIEWLFFLLATFLSHSNREISIWMNVNMRSAMSHGPWHNSFSIFLLAAFCSAEKHVWVFVHRRNETNKFQREHSPSIALWFMTSVDDVGEEHRR